MLYPAFESSRRTRQMWTDLSAINLHWQLRALDLFRPLGGGLTTRPEALLQAALTMNERIGRDYGKPAFEIHSVCREGETVPVQEQVVSRKPFANLLHFERQTDRHDPKVLLLAPMSGHYATLLRDTVQALLVDHDVYLTDWADAKEVPLEAGDFGFADYVDYIVDFLDHLGPNTHLIAVCQPTVPALVASSYLSLVESTFKPATVTLMGGPIDVAQAPTEVTRFADSRSMDWFRSHVIGQVPSRFAGAGRLVYPGFMQLSGFLAMNPERHVRSHWEMFESLVVGDEESSDKRAKFYDEYLAVCDLPARFYLETVDYVFKRRLLATEEFDFRGERVTPKQLRVPMLTVEGERDDISAPGQTLAAHELCTGLAGHQRYNYLQPGVGHYGVFSGGRWRSEICPRITDFIRRHDPECSPALHRIEVSLLSG